MSGPRPVQLKHEHAAVLMALDRIQAALHIEAAQLDQTWQQKGMAVELMTMANQLRRRAETFVADCQRVIDVVAELPPQLVKP